MPTERLQRRIDRLLDQADEALDGDAYQEALERARDVLALDANNSEAQAFISMAERRIGDGVVSQTTNTAIEGASSETTETPTSFANGRYTVARLLGEGGKKKVYLAHDSILDRDVAFAVIKTEGLDEIGRERIRREAQAMGRMGTHPCIMPIYDLGEEDGDPYMVQPVMSGGDVEELIEDADGPLPLERAMRIATQTAQGLVFAHSKGIIHRDLKPGNIWLDEDGAAKIGDFGLAVATDRSRLTIEKMMVGTVNYMPPEQATGGEVTPRADLYSLGAMLYEMCTGRVPFMGDDDIAVISQHVNTPPVAPSWHNPNIPRTLDSLIIRLMSKDPDERPQSADEVLVALDAVDLSIVEKTEQGEGSLDSMAGGVFVGRQREMDNLKSIFEEVLSGKGRMVTLVGEPGIGKTRTAQELATYAGMRGAQVLWGRSYESGGAPPYWPWVQAIRSHVASTQPDVLRSQMGSTASVIAEIVADVKERLPDIQEPAKLDDPESARFRLFDSIATFLKQASADSPIVLMLEDLHWSDKPSLMLLEFVARELANSKIMIVGNYRDMELNRRHPLSITLGDLTRERLFERILLRGLQRHDVERFIEIAAGITPPSALVDAVYTQTEGNPLFVTETVRLLIQEGDITAGRTTKGGTTSWEVRIPEGVREVIGRRLDRLSERCNEVLTIAAVIGRQFRFEVIKQLVSDTTEGQLLDALEEALSARIVEELPDEIGLYQFTHASMQETLTSELSTTRRVRLHARIAETLEELYGDDADKHAEELIPHFDEAEAVVGTERLVHYSVLAGEAALEAFAPQAAWIHFERAAARIPDADRGMTAARTFSGLGRAWLSAGGLGSVGDQTHQEYWDIFARGFDIYVELGENSSAVTLASHVVFAAAIVSGSTIVLEKALELATPGSVDAGRLMARLAIVHWLEFGDAKRQAEYERLALEISSATGDSAIEMLALAGRGVAAFQRYDYRESLVALLRVVELARSKSDLQAEAMAYFFAGASRLALGEGNRAEEQVQALSDLTDRTGSVGGLRYLLIAMYATSRGDWQEIRRATEVGGTDPFGYGSVLAFVADAQTELEIDVSPVEELSLDVQQYSKYPGMSLLGACFADSVQPESSGREGLIRLIDDTRSRMDRAAMRSDRYWALNTRLAAATSCLAESNMPEGLADWAYTELEPVSKTTFIWMSVDRMLGRLATALERQDDAISHFEDGLVFCRNAGYRPELAWTCSDYAEMLLDRNAPADREKATKLQDEAIAISTELGMKPLLERVLAQREILKA